jgi:hypothetical protein
MKRVLPLLILIASACSHSREACDVYSADSGSVSDQNAAQSFRSVSSPDFSDTVTVKEELTPALEQINKVTINSTALKKNAATFQTENETRKVDSKQQLQITTTSNQLASMSATIDLQRTQRNPSEQDQIQMDNDVQLLGQLAPESFEYNLYAYISGNYDVSKVPYLKKAAQLQPTNKDVIVQYVAYYVSLGEMEKAINYLDQWETSFSRDFSDIVYAKDVMNSVDENGILVVHGINDTYSVLFQQLRNKLRPDVQIVSLELLQSEQYRITLTSNGVILPETTLIDRSYLESLCRRNADRSLSLAMTIPREYLGGLSDQLFAVGLTFVYSKYSGFDNFYMNEFLWNTKLSKELVKELDQSDKELKSQLVTNYLPMLLQLRQVYVQKNDTSQVREIDKVVAKIAKASGKEEAIQKIIEGQK